MNLSLKNIEKLFFFFVAVLNLLPLLLHKFFPTLDGPAHLYNANLIAELLFLDNEHLNTFFSINNEPVPNWLGHALLVFFNFFIPAYLSDKILLIFLSFGLAYSFRYLIKNISPNNLFYSYFIFPFCYSFLFILGFYNFCLALVLLFITITYWVKNEDSVYSLKHFLFLSLLISLIYFSHIFVFAIFLITVSSLIFTRFLENRKKDKFELKNSLKKFLVLFAASLICLVLFILYFNNRPSLDNLNYLPIKTLFKWIYDLRPIIGYNYEIELQFSRVIFITLTLLAIVSLYFWVKELTGRRKFITKETPWLVIFFILVILYFTLPDSDNSAGFVSVRTLLLAFLFLIIFLSTISIPRWIGWICVPVILFSNFNLNSYYISVVNNQNKIVQSCTDASKHIESNSIVLPLNYSNNWLFGHYSNYLGIDKPMIVLDNYEASTGYFPIKWNNNDMPNILMGELKNKYVPCLHWKTNLNNSDKKIDYVFVIGKLPINNNPCIVKVNDIISLKYLKVFENDNCSLFQLKSYI
jgi:hypothetical protein